MCEAKIKKILFGLFFISFVSIVSLASAPITHAASTSSGAGGSVCKNGTAVYYYSSSNRLNITSELVGTDTSGAACKTIGNTFSYSSGTTFLANTACHDSLGLITYPTAGNTTGPFSAQTRLFDQTSAGCAVSSQDQVKVYKDEATAANTASATTSTASPTDGKTGCTIDSIGWLLCPVIDFGAKIADAALGFLSTTFLETHTELYSTSSATYTAWQWILGFANIIFVIVFLIIIFSQATGFGISNYGIKKMLPKLIIGVILINLSFFICSIMIDASNLLGYGFNKFFDTLAGTIKIGSGGSDPLATGSVFGGIATVILTTAAIGLALFSALGFFIPVLVAAIVGLLMIFLFLVARQAIIILCIIIAPLAFAAWLLPNTEKLFKRWWSIFLQLLMLFPIIALVFGASKLVSRIISSVYASSGSDLGNLSNASSIQGSGGTGSSLVGEIIAAAVLVVPLFAVPFLLKAAIGGIPVLGNLASKAYNGATRGAKNRTKNMTDPAFAGLRAQQRAGVRGFMGRNRAARDDNGNVKFDENGMMIGKGRVKRDANGKVMTDANGNVMREAGKPLRRTASQFIAETKRGFNENEKAYDQLGSELYQSRALQDPESLAGKAHTLNDRTGVLASQTKAIHEDKLKTELIEDAGLRAMDQKTMALGLSSATATNVRQEKFGDALKAEDTANIEGGLLTIAAGKVDASRGRTKAMAAATSAGYKVFDEGVNQQEALLTERLADIQKGTYQIQDQAVLDDPDIYQTDRDGRTVINGSKASQKYLLRQLHSSNSMEVAAARNKLLAQGASGVTAFGNEWASMQDSTHFESPEMKALQVEIERNTVSQHGPQLKGKEKSILTSFTSGTNISAVNNNPATWAGQNDGELAESTTAHLIRGVQNGGITAERAAAILSDDVIRNKFNQEQIQILQVLKDGGTNKVPMSVVGADGKTTQVEVESGRAAVSAIWDVSTGKLRSQPSSKNATGESDDRIDIKSVVVPGVPVPGAGSPPKTIVDFVDRAGGVSRLSRDNFVQLQSTVAQASGPADNEDLINLKAAVQAEVNRRNEEAQKINQLANATVYETIPGGSGVGATGTPRAQRSTEAPTVVIPSSSTPGGSFSVSGSGTINDRRTNNPTVAPTTFVPSSSSTGNVFTVDRSGTVDTPAPTTSVPIGSGSPAPVSPQFTATTPPTQPSRPLSDAEYQALLRGTPIPTTSVPVIPPNDDKA